MPGTFRKSVIVRECAHAFNRHFSLSPFMVIGFCVVLMLSAPSGHAQDKASQASQAVFDAANLREPVALVSPWLIHAGDEPAYARPDFDDTQWALFDPRGDLKDVFKTNHPEVIWYRLRVQVSPEQTGLALSEERISRAFEIYVNGERIMAQGQVAPFLPYTWNAKVRESIPNRLLASGSLLIALRVHIAPNEWAGQNPGYSAGNLTIGQQDTLERFDWLAMIGQNTATWIDHLLLACLGLVALVLLAAQRRQTEYLWIAALGIFTFVQSIEPVISVFYNFPLYWEALADTLLVLRPFLWVSLYFSFVQQRMGWRWRAILVITGILLAFSSIQSLYLVMPLILQILSNLLFIVLLSVVIPVVLAIHWRRGNREAGILLIPSVLFSIYVYAEVGFGILFQFHDMRALALRALDLVDRFPAGPFSIALNNVSGILSTLALAVIMLLRSTGMSRRQAILESELAAAQQVQQVLLPEQVKNVPGFQVESVYQPAQQVGGDFFQILPADEGGLLVVVGDVAGKGLPAAMLVSELVGSIRGVAEYTADPAQLLASLNERLVGRGGGSFSTALVAHISAQGEVVVANAGHLSPYLDGTEVELPGALPLGVMSGARYETTQFYLAPGSRLTFYSDGVIEAQSQQGELFGFDRAREISTQRAADIVEAAKKFGQEDDITVVTIERHATVATAA